MDTVGTGRAQQVRLSERQLGWRLPCPRRGRRPSISGTRFIPPLAARAAEGDGVARMKRVEELAEDDALLVMAELFQPHADLPLASSLVAGGKTPSKQFAAQITSKASFILPE